MVDAKRVHKNAVREAERMANQSEQEKWDSLSKRQSESKYASQAGPVSGQYESVLGRIEGLERAGQLYGMGVGDLGTSTQDIVSRRRAMLEGNDPATTRLQERKNEKIRQARASGATDDQIRQLERTSDIDIGQQEFTSQNEALSKYQSLIGNIIGGTTSLEMGMGGLENANQEIQVPSSGGLGGTVICTELHRQGYMSDDMLKKDSEYGEHVRLHDLAVYIGYIWLAMPIVSAMKKSKILTKLISYPALEWAKDMAYDNSLTGKMINFIGKPVCRFVGKIIMLGYNKGMIYA